MQTFVLRCEHLVPHSVAVGVGCAVVASVGKQAAVAGVGTDQAAALGKCFYK